MTFNTSFRRRVSSFSASHLDRSGMDLAMVKIGGKIVRPQSPSKTDPLLVKR